jgi:formamidopyrimidine-DNA glycosylase
LPELPEVETVTRALNARLLGRRIVGLAQRRPDLRFALPQDLGARLAGRRVEGLARRAKFILVHLDDGAALVMHLGMSGRLVFDGEPCGPHEHLTFGFDDGTRLRFVDPRRFGMLDLVGPGQLAAHRWLAPLGIEPLGPDLDAPRLDEAGLLAGRRVAIKTAIMDQRLVVGVGNIYASEALFRAGISPRRSALTLGPGRAARLVEAIKQVLSEAIAAGGSSLRDYVQANGELGSFQRDFRVYERAGQPCPRCAGPVRRIVQAGRASYYCGRCQR